MLGAEFCGNFEGKCLHFTALDYDYNHPGIRALIRRECEAMTEWTRRRFQRAVENGWISGLEWEQKYPTAEEIIPLVRDAGGVIA